MYRTRLVETAIHDQNCYASPVSCSVSTMNMRVDIYIIALLLLLAFAAFIFLRT